MSASALRDLVRRGLRLRLRATGALEVRVHRRHVRVVVVLRARPKLESPIGKRSSTPSKASLRKSDGNLGHSRPCVSERAVSHWPGRLSRSLERSAQVLGCVVYSAAPRNGAPQPLAPRTCVSRRSASARSTLARRLPCSAVRTQTCTARSYHAATPQKDSLKCEPNAS